MKASEITNIGVIHGKWGEMVARNYLVNHGYKIIECNSRPVPKDARLEIDIIARDCREKTLVFVEVKQHACHSEWERRTRSVTGHKRRLLKRTCNMWRIMNSYRGNYRFDIIEVFGTPKTGIINIDHIDHVNIFVDSERFVMWN